MYVLNGLFRANNKMLRAKEHKKSLLHECWYHRQEYFMATLNRETRSRKDFSRHMSSAAAAMLRLMVFHMTLQDEYAIIFNPHRTQRSRPSRKLLEHPPFHTCE